MWKCDMTKTGRSTRGRKMKGIKIPLKFDEAVSAFLKVKPEPKKAAKRKPPHERRQTNNQ
jgi:hypothetical protein